MTRYIYTLGFLLFIFQTQMAQAAKTFVYCSESSPFSLNPQFVNDAASANVGHQMYNFLTDFELGTTKLAPALAESWDISKDGMVYTFHLRKDVTFHKTDGFTPTRKMNADDVIFSFDRQRLKDHPYHKVGAGNYEIFESLEFPTLIKDIKKVDDYTVVFTLSHPEAPFLADLAIFFAPILSKEYGDQLLKAGTPDKIDQEPVGTGPFVFSKYVKDATLRFKAHPTYFKGKPKIENLVFSITPDASVRYQKLKTGECNLIAEPGFADLPAIKSNSDLAVTELQMLNVGFLALNVTKKPFDSLLVRKAIYHALNRKSYLDAIYLGRAVINKNPMPILQWGYNDKITDYEYSVEKAKALLKQAGHAKGLSFDLWTLPVSRAYNPNGKRMGEMMQSDLAKIGIKVKLVTTDWPTYVAKTKTGEMDALQFGWNSDNGDPDNFLHVLLSCESIKSGSNKPHWCYKPYDQLVQKAKLITDQKERTKLYQQAQVIFHEQVPYIPLVSAYAYRGMSKKVLGYKMSAIGNLDIFESVDLVE